MIENTFRYDFKFQKRREKPILLFNSHFDFSGILGIKGQFESNYET